jgi:hypothetical protein
MRTFIPFHYLRDNCSPDGAGAVKLPTKDELQWKGKVGIISFLTVHVNSIIQDTDKTNVICNAIL